MTHRRLSAIARLACAITTFLWLPLSPTDLKAADAHLDAGTIFVLSIDDVKAFGRGLAASDYGAFYADPATQEIWKRVRTGAAAMISKTIRETSEDGAMDPESKKAFNTVSGLISSYWDALREHSTGGFSFSIGIRSDAEGQIQPQFICHHQGGDPFADLHQRLIDIVGKLDPSLAPTTFFLQGVEFRGIQFPPAPGLPGVIAPDGLYWGRKGNDYYLGVSRAGLSEYLAAATAAEGATGGNARLGSSVFYQRAVADCGRGHLNVLLNLDPIWQLYDRYGAAIPDRDMIQTVIDVLALRHFHGYYGTMTAGAAAIEQSALVAVDQKVGLWSLMPATNEPVVMPAYLDKSSLMAMTTKMNFDRVMPLVENLARALGGDEAVGEMNEFIEEGKTEAGVDIPRLLAGLDGSIFYAQPKGAMPAGLDLEAMLTQSAVIGFKLRDPGLYRSTIDKIVGMEPGMCRPQTIGGQAMHVIGGSPEQDDASGMGGGDVPNMAFGVDGDWLLIGMPVASLETAMAARQLEGAANRVASDPRFAAALAKIGDTGVMASYSDAGSLLANSCDMLRPFMAMVPFLLGEYADDPEVQQLADPRNIPSAELIKRYFGIGAAVMQSVDGGWRLRGITPRVSPLPKAPEAAPDKAPEKF